MTLNRIKSYFQEKTGRIDPRRYQDSLFLVGIFLFTAVLIIGLFPEKDADVVIWKNYLVYAFMSAPVIAAIYFIITSFQRKLTRNESRFGESIQKKMTIAFLFVASLPALIVVLVSNNFINRAFDNLISDNITNAFNETLVMVEEPFSLINSQMREEIKSLEYQLKSGILELDSGVSRNRMKRTYTLRGINAFFFKKNLDSIHVMGRQSSISSSLAKLYSRRMVNKDESVERLNLNGTDYISVSLETSRNIIILMKKFPADYKRRLHLLRAAYSDYERLEYLKVYFRNSSGVILLGLSIVMFIVSFFVSIYLSKTITRPVLQLAEAARDVSARNFDIRLTTTSHDELGFLFRAFNRMVDELAHSSKIYYQKQRLEAWREVARQLVHEIKNPLTPIRLSAERMRNRYIEDHPKIKSIILSGTQTIIDEVKALMVILNDFTQFARLPEMKPGMVNLNGLIESCVNMYSGHERIRFEVKLDKRIKDIRLDKILFRQVIINILQNSVDAIENEGIVEVQSRLVSGERKNRVRVRIADNGIGMEKQELERIFEPGYSTKFSGTGLGLAIVEKIIVEHGGTIDCFSEVGTGTEFIIDLPADIVEDSFNGAHSDN